jgi:predicted RecA/RadA family phage recombinase
MKNYVSAGENITLTAPYARLSGEGALVGALFGVAVTDVDNGAEGVFATEGIFTIAKATGASTGGSQGAKAYWVAGSKSVSAVSSSNTLIGVFAATCADGDATAQVRLNGVAV